MGARERREKKSRLAPAEGIKPALTAADSRLAPIDEVKTSSSDALLLWWSLVSRGSAGRRLKPAHR
jgi:hypothetical protein